MRTWPCKSIAKPTHTLRMIPHCHKQAKEVPHTCTIEAMHVGKFILGFKQRCKANIRHNGVDTIFVCTIVSTKGSC